MDCHSEPFAVIPSEAKQLQFRSDPNPYRFFASLRMTDFRDSRARNLALDIFNARRDSSSPAARLSTSYSLNTSTSLDPANRISLMVLDPFGLVA